MRFKKSFGQNFLRDKRFILKIVSSLDIDNDTVVEIGPGSGQITRHLVNKAKMLYCIEKDVRFINLLKERFASDSVEFINGDILEFDLSFLEEKAVIFGNVPFNISNHLIKYLISNRNFIKKGYFTFQKEFARKLAASFNTKDYGYLSCFVHYYAGIKVMFDIPKEAFHPVPGVDASFVSVRFLDEPQVKVDDESFLFKLIRRAFLSRRKKVINAFADFGDRGQINDVFKKLNVSPSLRPENLSLKDYCNISMLLLKDK